jgi:hypothetical protein
MLMRRSHPRLDPVELTVRQHRFAPKVSVAPATIGTRAAIVVSDRSSGQAGAGRIPLVVAPSWMTMIRSNMTNEQTAEAERDPYLLAQVREAFGRVVYSHKTHEKQADMSFRRHRWQQGALIALTAVSSGTFLASVLGVLVNSELASLATSFIALLVTAMSLGAKTFRFAEEADTHRDIASRLWDVRESYLSLISDLMSGATSVRAARERREELQQAARAAYADAPRTTNKAFSQASDGLKNKEELTFTSGEIDLFLPEALRLNKGEA